MIQWIIFTDERAGRPRAPLSRSESYLTAFPPGRGAAATGKAAGGVTQGGACTLLR